MGGRPHSHVLARYQGADTSVLGCHLLGGEYNSTMEERIMELESRVAFQDQTIRDLDEVVRLFSNRVEQLERRVSELASGLRSGREEVGPHDEQPPHY